MTEENAAAQLSVGVADLVIAASMALLLLTIVGSLLGMAVWPILGFVYQHANRALAVVTVAVDCAAALIGAWIFSQLSRTQLPPPTGAPQSLLYKNRRLFAVARFSSVVLAVLFVLQLLALEFRTVLFQYIGSFTELNGRSVTWTLLIGILLPAVLFVLLLLLGSRSNQNVAGV
jgi:hypothetical protein